MKQLSNTCITYEHMSMMQKKKYATLWIVLLMNLKNGEY